MKHIIHKDSVFTRHHGKDNHEIIRWGRYISKDVSNGFVDEIINALKSNNLIATGCEEEPGIFILYEIDGNTILYCDPGVPVRLYYSFNDDILYLAHTDKKVVELIGKPANLDYTGIYQRLVLGSTIGCRTRFEGVYALEPGSIVVIDQQGSIRKAYIQYESITGVTLNDIWRSLLEEIDHINSEKIGIMLSAGYDSRLLLAACLQQKRPLEIAYTHGLLGSKELSVSYKLAVAARIKRVVHVDAGRDMYGSASELRSFFENMGILYQVFWRLAGSYFCNIGVTPICGVQAEILNGQYLNGLLLGAISRFEKYRIGKLGYDAYIGSEEDFAEFFMNRVSEQVLDYILPKIYFRMREAREATKADLRFIAREYRECSHSWNDAVIRFLCDHDGSKQMAQQASFLRHYCPVATPFVGRKVFHLCMSYDNDKKMYGQAMRELLRKNSPLLSRFICTKSFIPVSYPDKLHFICRAFRSVFDKVWVKQFMKSKGKRINSLARMSWIGGDVWVREGDEICELKSLITGAILDPHAINDLIDKITRYCIEFGDGNKLLRVLESDLLEGSGSC